jgi:hypothetical protein
MQTDSIDGVLAILKDWISFNTHGVVWVKYVSDVSRDLCIERLGKDLAISKIQFQPPDPAFASIWLEEHLSQIPLSNPLPVLCVKFPITLSGSEQTLLDAIASLNLRREDLIQRPLIQIWWIADRLSPLVENVAPDLTSWFKLRLNLREISSSSLGNPELETFERLRVQPNQYREGSLERALASYENARIKLDPSNPASMASLAAAAGILSSRYSALGMRSEALAPALESLRQFKELAGRDKEAFLPDLAMSLNNLAAVQSDVGMREEALATAQEAVNLNWELSGRNREAFLPDLAMSLNNLAKMQSEVGKWEKALATAEESVNLRMELAELNREAFLSDLAVSLSTVSTLQSAVGKREEALATAEKAVKLNGELAGRNREAFLPDLAMSLNNLANRQSEVGNMEAALATAEETVKLRRELAERNREAFVPKLALSLGALSQVHAGRQEHDLAVEALHEALTLIAPFLEQNPQAFSSLSLQLAQDYLQESQQTAQPPDQALLARIQAKLPPQ